MISSLTASRNVVFSVPRKKKEEKEGRRRRESRDNLKNIKGKKTKKLVNDVAQSDFLFILCNVFQMQAFNWNDFSMN